MIWAFRNHANGASFMKITVPFPSRIYLALLSLTGIAQ
jgi:hypothetical protein